MILLDFSTMEFSHIFNLNFKSYRKIVSQILDRTAPPTAFSSSSAPGDLKLHSILFKWTKGSSQLSTTIPPFWFAILCNCNLLKLRKGFIFHVNGTGKFKNAVHSKIFPEFFTLLVNHLTSLRDILYYYTDWLTTPGIVASYSCRSSPNLFCLAG